MPTVLIKVFLGTGTFVVVSGVWTSIYLSNTGTTIRDKVSEEGLEFITKLEDYKIHLFEHRDDEKLQQAIGHKKINFEEHVSNLKQWCDSKIKGWASKDKSETILENVKSWCTVPTIRTLRDKIKGDLHDSGEWQKKYKHFAGKSSDNNNNFLAALKAEYSTFSTDDGGKKLEDWCSTSMWMKTYEVNEHKSEENIKAWCIKEE